MDITNNHNLREQANDVLVGGVNSPARSFAAVEHSPIYAEQGKGAVVIDVEGEPYIDYLMGWGSLVLGHQDETVKTAIQEQLDRGWYFGLSTEYEAQWAQLIKSAYPEIDKIRFVNSGTEAIMTAVRLARAVTKRDKLLTFEGAYHGHGDSVLVQHGSGVLKHTLKDTLVAPYNDLTAVSQLVKKHHHQLAAILVEPVAGNMGVIPPQPGFLEELRALADQYSVMLIFDEVITGFRLAWGGAQAYYNVHADITVLGKIIGGGFPCGAIGARSEIMDHLAPLGPVFQAGTWCGHPLSCVAGVATLEKLKELDPYKQLEDQTQAFARSLEHYLRRAKCHATVNRVGSMWTLFFTDHPVKNYHDVQHCLSAPYNELFNKLLSQEILLPPSSKEAAFLSVCHDQALLEKTLDIIRLSYD